VTQPTRAQRRDELRRRIARTGEDLAEAHFNRLGFSTLARNARTRAGEIDLIVFHAQSATLVFAEIKTRAVRGPHVRPDQQPLPWLRARQRARLRRLATAWLSNERQHRPSAETVRFDAVGVIVDLRGRLLRLDHLENAW